jgi:Capsular polysaccharide biosynthesis protein
MEATELMQKKYKAFNSCDNNIAEESGIDFVGLLNRLYDNLKYIVLALIIGAAVMGVCTYYFITPQYESTAKLYVLNSNNSILNLSDLQVGSYLASDYQEVFKTREVNEQVIQDLNLNCTYAELMKMVKISNPNDTRILYITVTTSDAELSALMANEYANVARKYISQTMMTEMPNVLSTALVPIKPVSPNLKMNILLGALMGVLLAVAIVAIAFILDDKIKSEDDLIKYGGLVTLAIVPYLNETIKDHGKKITGSNNRKGVVQ